jgi:hypothetical protein
MSEITPREILLREMREISFALTRSTWNPELPYQLWAVLAGDGDSIEGKRLAAPVLAHIDALSKYADDCGGWFTGESLDAFVDIEDWETRYAKWRESRSA